jgi:hypothetical protein
VRIFLFGNSQGIGLLGNQQESRAAANDERLREEPCPPDARFGGPLLKFGMSGQPSSVSGISTLRPAGLAASTGAVTALWLKSPEDPIWDADDGMKEYRAFMKEWAPNEQIEDSVFAYSTAQMIVEILKNCGDDLSRENLIDQATNIRGLQLPMFLPGAPIDVSPSARIGWRRARMARFDGSRWVLLDEVIGHCQLINWPDEDAQNRIGANEQPTECCHRRSGNWRVERRARVGRARHERYGLRRGGVAP